MTRALVAGLVLILTGAAGGCASGSGDRAPRSTDWSPAPVTVQGMSVLSQSDATGLRLHTGSGAKTFLPGVNLGSSVPGRQPGEVGGIEAATYRTWFAQMGGLGIRLVRIYTLHPPAFYAELARYNQAHERTPLYLVQGAYLPDESYFEPGKTLYWPAVDQSFSRELEDLDRLRSEFVATVSHELRTPLTSIIGEVEMLEDGDYGQLTGIQTQRLEVIGRNGARLLTLIEDLLTLNHIETSALHLHREPTLVARLLDGVRSQVERIAAAKSVELTFACSTGTDTVVVDREQLDRALLNLLTNAVKFTPEGGTVALQVGRQDDELVVTIADTGFGIPEDEQGGLFTRFFRSSVANRLAIPGTGLGLVIVKRIVEEHGGTVSVVSAQDAGTTVTVRIPANPSGVRADAA